MFMLLSLLLALLIAQVRTLADFPVDVVFTYVKEPSPDKYNEIKRTCISSFGSNKQRFRDTGTFQFALRAVEMFLPWVRKIHVVTDGAFPCWLQESNKVTFVTHRSIWPHQLIKKQLPTYNSVAIEAHLHRIGDLSEHFLYLNDDMIFAKPLPKSYFFNLTDGTPFTSVKDMFWLPYEMAEVEKATRSGTHPGSYMGTHGPYTARRRDVVKVHQLWPEYVRTISATTCRDPASTLPQNSHSYSYGPPFWVYQWFGIVHNFSVPVVRDVQFLNSFVDPNRFYSQALSSRTADMFVINDDFSTEPLTADAQVLAQQEFLERYFGYDLLSPPYGGGQMSYFRPKCILTTDVVYPRNQSLIGPPPLPAPFSALTIREQLEILGGVLKPKGGSNISSKQTFLTRSSEHHLASCDEENMTLPKHLSQTSSNAVSGRVHVGHFGDHRSTYQSAPFGSGASLFQQDVPVRDSTIPEVVFSYAIMSHTVNDEASSWRALCRQLPQDADVIFVNRLSSATAKDADFPSAQNGANNNEPAHMLAQCMRRNYVAVRYDHLFPGVSFSESGGDVDSHHGVILSKYRLRDVFVLRECNSPYVVLGASIPISSCVGASANYTDQRQSWLDVILIVSFGHGSVFAEPSCGAVVSGSDRTRKKFPSAELVKELLLHRYGNRSRALENGRTGHRSVVIVSEKLKHCGASSRDRDESYYFHRTAIGNKRGWTKQKIPTPVMKRDTQSSFDVYGYSSSSDGEGRRSSMLMKMSSKHTWALRSLPATYLSRQCLKQATRDLIADSIR